MASARAVAQPHRRPTRRSTGPARGSTRRASPPRGCTSSPTGPASRTSSTRSARGPVGLHLRRRPLARGAPRARADRHPVGRRLPRGPAAAHRLVRRAPAATGVSRRLDTRSGLVGGPQPPLRRRRCWPAGSSRRRSCRPPRPPAVPCELAKTSSTLTWAARSTATRRATLAARRSRVLVVSVHVTYSEPCSR